MKASLVFTALEASNASEEYVKFKRENNGGGMPLYIPRMEYSIKDKKGFLPVMQSELITVLGRPGNGKTGFMLRWARERAADLKKQAALGSKEAENSVVLYVTMEQLIEELRLFTVAADIGVSATDIVSGQVQDWDAVTNSMRKLHTTPLWFIGKSRARRKDKMQINEKTLREAFESVERWQDQNLLQGIDSIFIDYLQRFRSSGNDWVQFYGDMVNALKDMAGDFSTRIVLGVQAKREVDARDVKTPEMDDGQWTSGIEQQSDGMISVTRPSHYVAIGGEFNDGGSKIRVQDHNDMLVKVLKRKMGPENFFEYVKLQPEFNRLISAEMKSYDPNKDKDNYREVKNVV